MLEPFSKRARPWERHGIDLRRLAGVSQEELLDPWKLAPKVGLRVLDGDASSALLAEPDRLHLCGAGSRAWSGGVWPERLPDGSRICILPSTPVEKEQDHADGGDHSQFPQSPAHGRYPPVKQN